MPKTRGVISGDKQRIRSLRLRIFLCVADALWVIITATAAFWMTTWAKYQKPTMSWPVAGWVFANVIVALSLFMAFRLYSMVFSNAGILDAIRVLAAVFCLLALNMIYVSLIGQNNRDTYHIGYSAVLFYCLMLLLGVSSVRFLKRLYEAVVFNIQRRSGDKTRVMIVGCGDAGVTLLRKILFNDKSIYRPVCIVDDNPQLLGKLIYDVRVVGTTNEVQMAVKKYNVEEIFVALPSANKAEQREIIGRCKECSKPIKMLPELSKLTGGEISVPKLRQVQIQDLLGRDQVSVNLDEVMGYIEHKVVLVTGGGGSIGSELCRQIALHNPKQLIILDIYENNAYDIEQELKRHYPDLNLLTLIASIRDKKKVRDVFEKYKPQIVFNAAAHKHVPLMETSPNEAVKNNVFGTLNVARAADEYEAETFVQISTDKAVNPTNIMGATKRICEMIIQTIGKNSKHTKFVAVRFGNVLGSNGSVVPLFKRQIAEGGPVTVTHKDIIRYFMTIPEAVSLVLQAGAYAQGGQIFVLDMGEPVKIYDLAYNLIKLSGFEPNVDIEIKCTGLRPGEKLFEERLMAEEGLQKTANGLISIAKPIPMNEAGFWASLDKLYEAAYSETDKMKEWVKVLVPTYTIDKRESPAITFMRAEALGNNETVAEAAISETTSESTAS